MKRIIACIILVLCIFSASAEEVSVRALEEADMDALYRFADEYDVQAVIDTAMEGALKGDLPDEERIIAWLKKQIQAPMEHAGKMAGNLVPPVLLLALMRAVSRGEKGATAGARFLLRLQLLGSFMEIALFALAATRECLTATSALSDAVAPALTTLLAAMGLNGSAALVSPAAAIAGNAAERLFLKHGLPLCRIALCSAIAGNLSPALDMSRITAMFKKTANWGAGLATTLFTALLALQGTITETLDSVAVRTAKFAVDSATPVIGNGVSDAWESYVSGVLIAKNAVGVSGISALIAAGFKPVLVCLAAMVVLNACAAFLDLLGEKETGRAAGQIAGICQMAVSLATGGLAIAMVLLGAMMAAGRCLGT